MPRFDPTYELCHLCKEYYIPTIKEQEAYADVVGHKWTCSGCYRMLARESARPFNMDYDYQEPS